MARARAALMRRLVYEVHTRHWLARLGVALGDVPEAALDELAAVGATHLWLMGVWRTGPGAVAEARRALPGQDVAASPYAIAAYEVAPEYGGEAGLAALRARLAARGIAIVLDFVPNHVGIDHAWLRDRPELFVFEGGAIAHGRDPYFPPWTDTAQLDYRRAETRRAMVDQLAAIAARCDGVRCDMAMLVLADVFARTWGGDAGAEFWPEAIAAARAAHPGFVLLAEAYWGLEPRLIELGFDAAYDKELCDSLIADRAVEAAAHVRAVDAARGVHFLENHDEPRIAERLDLARHRAAALVVLGLPGTALVHDGQLAGLRRHAAIQLRRRADEPEDAELAAMYRALTAACRELRGEGRVLEPRGGAGFVIVQWQDRAERFELVVVNLAAERAACRVVVPGAAGHGWRLADRLGVERWDRDGDELAGPGLYLELPAHGAQVFEVTRR